MVWAPCKQGPCCHIQPTLRPGSLSAQAHPFWEINTNLNKVTSTELDLSKNVLIPENVVVAFFFQPVRLKSMEKKSPEMKSWGELFYESFCFDFSWNTSKHKYRTFRDLAGSKPAMIPTPSFFSTTCLQEKCDGDEGKCCLWYICEFVRIHPTIEWTHCGGGILFGISDDLSKT